MKKLLVALMIVGIIASATSIVGQVAADDNGQSSIVGAWEVTAVAPYPPHLLTFNADGTMLSTNPTNVQESAAKPNGGTNDSVGMGTWKVQKVHGTSYVVGTFEELNALADTHQPTDKLSVSFKVRITNGGKSFDGPATATVGSETDPSHLTGTRMAMDQRAINAL